MKSAIGQTLPLAIAVAISPIPIIAVTLMLVTKRARSNGPLYVLGSVVGLVFIGVIALTVADAAGAGFVLQTFNPKNLLLAIGAATTIAATGISGADQAIAYAVFTIIGTIGVATPVIVYFAMGDRAPRLLERLKEWMALHSDAIMATLFLVLGAKVLGDGIGGF